MFMDVVKVNVEIEKVIAEYESKMTAINRHLEIIQKDIEEHQAKNTKIDTAYAEFRKLYKEERIEELTEFRRFVEYLSAYRLQNKTGN